MHKYFYLKDIMLVTLFLASTTMTGLSFQYLTKQVAKPAFYSSFILWFENNTELECFKRRNLNGLGVIEIIEQFFIVYYYPWHC